MEIILNGKSCVLSEGCTVSGLLINENIPPGSVVIEHNGRILDREKPEDPELKSGDEVELIAFMGGG